MQLIGGTPNERAEVRMEVAAQDLFEKVLRRRNWVASDRDAVARWLDNLVRKEMRIRGPKG